MHVETCVYLYTLLIYSVQRDGQRLFKVSCEIRGWVFVNDKKDCARLQQLEADS